MQAVAASRQPAQRRKWRDEGLQGEGQTFLTDEERRVDLGIMNTPSNSSIRFLDLHIDLQYYVATCSMFVDQFTSKVKKYSKGIRVEYLAI